MILLVGGDGPLRVAMMGGIEAHSDQVRSGEANDEDLFMKALNCEAVVYAPSQGLLQGTLEPSPDPERIDRVLRACNAPGVKLLVVVQPQTEHYEVENEKVRKAGVPYLIVQSPPLLEEVGPFVAGEEVVRVPKGKTVSMASSESLTDAVKQALVDNDQGRVVKVGGEGRELAEVLQQALQAAGASTKVKAVSETWSRMRRTVGRWFGSKESPALALFDRLEEAQKAQASG